MAPQGHDAGATSHKGVCENSNLERQGCSPFYQELIEDPYVDPVSGFKTKLCHSSLFFASGQLLKLQKMPEWTYDSGHIIWFFFPSYDLYIPSKTVSRQNEYWFQTK